MTELEIIAYFKDLSSKLKLIGHEEIDKKRRFAASHQEAWEGMKSKIDFKHHCLFLHFTSATYENNSADNQLKYIPLNLVIVRNVGSTDFVAQNAAITDAAIIWEKVLSKLLRDRDHRTGIRNFDKSRITVDYVRGEILDDCYGITVELKIETKPDVRYLVDDWIGESTNVWDPTMDDSFGNGINDDEIKTFDYTTDQTFK